MLKRIFEEPRYTVAAVGGLVAIQGFIFTVVDAGLFSVSMMLLGLVVAVGGLHVEARPVLTRVSNDLPVYLGRIKEKFGQLKEKSHEQFKEKVEQFKEERARRAEHRERQKRLARELANTPQASPTFVSESPTPANALAIREDESRDQSADLVGTHAMTNQPEDTPTFVDATPAPASVPEIQPEKEFDPFAELVEAHAARNNPKDDAKMIEFSCPNCGLPMRVQDAFAGKAGRCKSCGGAVMVPIPNDLPAPVPSLNEHLVSAAPPTAVPPTAVPPTAATPLMQQQRVLCPFCGELIAPSAVKCRFCNEFLDGRTVPPSPSTMKYQTSDGSRVLTKTKTESQVWSSNPQMFGDNPVAFVLACILIPVYGVGLLVLFGWWLHCLSTTLIVTNRRTILRTGILAKNTREVRHEDVRYLEVRQSFFNRIFGVGTIAISSAGQSGLELEISGIDDPQAVKRMIDQYR